MMVWIGKFKRNENMKNEYVQLIREKDIVEKGIAKKIYVGMMYRDGRISMTARKIAI